MPINPQVFREYDIRGIAGRDLDEGAYETLGKATAKYIENSKKYNRMAVGRDGRLTSPAYSQALKGVLRAEIDKDFVKMPVHEIEKHLTAA